MGEVAEYSTVRRQWPCVALCLLGFLLILGSLVAAMVYNRASQGLYLNLTGLAVMVAGVICGRIRSGRRSRTDRLGQDGSPSPSAR